MIILIFYYIEMVDQKLKKDELAVFFSSNLITQAFC